MPKIGCKSQNSSRWVKETYEKRHEDKRDGRSDQDARNGWNVPRHRLVLARPTHPENTNYQYRPCDHRACQALFGRWEPAPALDQRGVLAREQVVDDAAERRADADADEREAVLTNGEPARLDVDNWEGLE